MLIIYPKDLIEFNVNQNMIIKNVKRAELNIVTVFLNIQNLKMI